MTVLSFQGVHVALGQRQILSGIDLSFSAGECVGILGPNGSGKSTMMRTAAGLITPTAGRVDIEGRALPEWPRRDLSRRLAYLPQGGEVHWPMSVRNVVALGRLPHGGRMPDASHPAVLSAMKACDVDAFADRPVSALSGGERARVLMARAMAGEAKVILADEPFAQLDPSHQLHAMEVMQGEAARGALVIVVLHDLSIAARYCSRVVLLTGGKIEADGAPAETLSGENLRSIFGVDAFIGEHAGGPVILPVRRRSLTLVPNA
jgi:iron complex transport system ATP-binding protein